MRAHVLHITTMTDRRAMFTWNVGDHFLAVGQPHHDALSVGRIGLLGLFDEGLEYHAFRERRAIERILATSLLHEWPGAVHSQQRGFCADLLESYCNDRVESLIIMRSWQNIIGFVGLFVCDKILKNKHATKLQIFNQNDYIMVQKGYTRLMSNFTMLLSNFLYIVIYVAKIHYVT